jgi:hypothetical protein
MEATMIDYVYGGNYIKHRCLQQKDRAFSIGFGRETLVDSVGNPMCVFDDQGKVTGCRFHVWVALANKVADLNINYKESTCGITSHFVRVFTDIATQEFDLNTTSLLYDMGVGEGEYIVAFTATQQGLDPLVNRHHRLIVSPNQGPCTIDVVASENSNEDDKLAGGFTTTGLVIAIGGGAAFVIVFCFLFYRSNMTDKHEKNSGHIRMLK